MAIAPEFVARLVDEGGELTFELTDGSRTAGIVRFAFVRAYAFVKESDFWSEFARQAGEPVFNGEGSPRVARLTEGALLAKIVGNRFSGDEPRIYRLWTPDECYEIAAFEDPRWQPVASEEAGD